MKRVRASVEAVDSTDDFITKMREAAPFGDVRWYEPMWDIGTLTRAGKRRHIATRDALWFVRHRHDGEPAVPFAAEFDAFAKAVICARHVRGAQTAGAHRVTLRALRYLCDALAERGTTNPRQLELRDFRVAEVAALRREKASSAYRVGQRLEEISTLVDTHRIAPVEVRYRSSIPRGTGEAGPSKMPNSTALDALGELSSSPELALRQSDLVMMRVVDLLVASGMRVGEVLTLPAKPIVNDGEGFGLRYWPEKGAQARIKRFASVQRELVERAVSELSVACAPARRVARWCQAHPGRAPIPKTLSTRVYPKDIVGFGLAKNGTAWLRARRVRVAHDFSASRRNVEAALVAMRDERPIVRTADGKTQYLGESLIVVFLHELHAARSTNRFVPIPLTVGALADFLGARDNVKPISIFARYAKRDAAGHCHRITTHQFRHWLHTVAARGGLSEVELARWMGRRRIADNRAYDHRTHEERVEEAPALVRAGRASGPIAMAYRSLPPAEADAFLAAQVNAVLSTPYGLCVHDYAQGPCERHFSCAGCSELLRTKGDERERTALEASLDRTRSAIAGAEAEKAAGTYGAGNWVAHHRRLEIDLIALLAVEDDTSRASGERVRVHPHGHGARLDG